MDRWQTMVVGLAILAGVTLGWNGAVERAMAPVTDANLERELFEAVRQELAKANLPPQDMPKRVLEVQKLGPDRYKVHMEMGMGDSWFECTRQGGKWTVKGVHQ